MDTYQISFWLFSKGCFLFYNLFIMYCVSNTLFPQKTQDFLINAGWTSLKLYHVARLKTETFVKQQLEYYIGNDYKQYFNSIQNNIQLERTYYVKDNIETNCLLSDADMVLTYYHNLKNEDNITPVLRSKEADSFSSVLIDNKYCSFKFINIILLKSSNNDNDIEINLFKPYNFYLEGNIILDKTFLKWYCNKYHKLELNNEYKIQIIDDNANFIYLNNEQGIKLNKDDYEIIYNNNEEIDKNLINNNDNDNDGLRRRTKLENNLEN